MLTTIVIFALIGSALSACSEKESCMACNEDATCHWCTTANTRETGGGKCQTKETEPCAAPQVTTIDDKMQCLHELNTKCEEAMAAADGDDEAKCTACTAMAGCASCSTAGAVSFTLTGQSCSYVGTGVDMLKCVNPTANRVTTAPGCKGEDEMDHECDLNSCTECTGNTNCHWCTLTNNRKTGTGECKGNKIECDDVASAAVVNKDKCYYDRDQECNKVLTDFEEANEDADLVAGCNACIATPNCAICSTAGQITGVLGGSKLTGGTCNYVNADDEEIKDCVLATANKFATKEECDAEADSPAATLVVASAAAVVAAIAQF